MLGGSVIFRIPPQQHPTGFLQDASDFNLGNNIFLQLLEF